MFSSVAMVDLAVRGVGLTELGFYTLLSPFVITLFAIPFGWQMHRTSDLRGLLRGVGIAALTVALNIFTVWTYWPLKLGIVWSEDRLIEISNSLKPGERRRMEARIGPIGFRDAWKLPNGNTCFTSGHGYELDANGLIYSPSGNPRGMNEWSSVRVAENWAVVEQD